MHLRIEIASSAFGLLAMTIHYFATNPTASTISPHFLDLPAASAAACVLLQLSALVLKRPSR
jgi:hypothetical protein